MYQILVSQKHAAEWRGTSSCLAIAHSLPQDGAVYNRVQIIKLVMSSTAKAELGTLYINTKHAILLLQMLLVIGHAQPPVPIQIDDLTTYGMVTNKIILEATKEKWICFSTGFAIANNNDNSSIIGAQETQTALITGPNTTLLHTTN